MSDQIDQTNAAEYVERAMRSRLDDIAALQLVVNGDADLIDQRELEGLDIGAEFDDHELQNDSGALLDAAQDHLDALPLCVDRTVCFEIVLGTGGPDDRLIVECDSGGDPGDMHSFEIRRILYRYSWSGSAEVELVGEDRTTAEAFAHRVVLELSE